MHYTNVHPITFVLKTEQGEYNHKSDNQQFQSFSQLPYFKEDKEVTFEYIFLIPEDLSINLVEVNWKDGSRQNCNFQVCDCTSKVLKDYPNTKEIRIRIAYPATTV